MEPLKLYPFPLPLLFTTWEHGFLMNVTNIILSSSTRLEPLPLPTLISCSHYWNSRLSIENFRDGYEWVSQWWLPCSSWYWLLHSNGHIIGGSLLGYPNNRTTPRNFMNWRRILQLQHRRVNIISMVPRDVHLKSGVCRGLQEGETGRWKKGAGRHRKWPTGNNKRYLFALPSAMPSFPT